MSADALKPESSIMSYGSMEISSIDTRRRTAILQPVLALKLVFDEILLIIGVRWYYLIRKKAAKVVYKIQIRSKAIDIPEWLENLYIVVDFCQYFNEWIVNYTCLGESSNFVKDKDGAHDIRISTTSIEYLSNEIFYEVFDYLDDYDIFESFSKLNNRFQHLLICLFLRLKIKISHLSLQNRSIQNRYIDFNLKQSRTTTDFLLNHLESLRFIDIESNNILQRLSILSLLPRLMSLTIIIEDDFKNLNDIYLLIFKIPALKFIKISYNQYNPYIPLPIATIYQITSIERLNINHTCRIINLITILSYTPQLSHLTCKGLIDWDEVIQDFTITLPYLTYISLGLCFIQFNEFEIFIKKLSHCLEVLKISFYDNKTYIDGNRWKQLISQYLPQLQKFYFRHDEIIDSKFNVIKFYEQINQFNSLFWIERQWISNLSISISGTICKQIMFSVSPYKKKWNQSSEYIENNSYDQKFTSLKQIQHGITTRESSAYKYLMRNFQSVDLIIKYWDFNRYENSILYNVIPILKMTKITHLNIQNEQFFIGLFVNLLRMLPDLESLELKTLSTKDYNSSPYVYENIFNSLSANNKITKILLTCANDFKQIQFFIDLCPYIQYFEIYCSNDTNIESLVRLILMDNLKLIPNLNILCLSIPTANDKLVDELHKVLKPMNLYANYMVKRLLDKIHIQWK
ncbi:unnamed protein product [Adineta steineri]|uniref:F-box domain-containing protein n=1 Tax=Adineta steineri TaxID=433720 RepID=A0A814T7W1_9BILA|nr:unnamed protein product [Adineta steineri]CAF3582350.1 unnamed protein product [Adineta steineri]